MSGYFSQYMYHILTVGLCAFLCEAVSGFGKSKRLSNAAALITSLCLFLTAVMPITELFSGIGKFFPDIKAESADEQEYTRNDFFELVKMNIIQELKSEILIKTGIEVSDISIDLNVKDKNIYITSVTVQLFEKTEDTQAISKVITDNFSSETEIYFTE